jgi:hypothetical protein
VVGAVTQSKAIYCDIPRAAHKLKLPGRLVRRWNEQGLDLIAEGLIRDSVAVF